MEKVATRILNLRNSMGLTQKEFAKRIASSRGYLSQLEASVKIPGPDFLAKLETLEKSHFATKVASEAPAKVAEASATYGDPKVISNVEPKIIRLRQIPIYSFAQAGQAVEFEGQPTAWEDTIEYDGDDEKAFALRVAGDSMEPKFPEGTIITVSPKHPPHNGQLVVAKIKNAGYAFKRFHHSGDGTMVTLSSFNRVYPDLVFPREKLHWLYRVVRATQNL